MFCKVCKYRKYLSVCTAVLSVDIVSSVICTVNIVCIFAVGSLGIGYGVIVTLCTSCNFSKYNVCIVSLRFVSILSTVYSIAGKRNVYGK